MTYELTIEQKPTYLHAIVTGRNRREHVARYLEDILQECRDAGRLVRRLAREMASLWVFLREHGVDPTNNPTTSLSCADQICTRRIAAFRAQVTKGSGVLRTHKPL
jgi:hypothetical protein